MANLPIAHGGHHVLSKEPAVIDNFRRMKVLIAPDKFKGSLTASNAAKAMARGVRRAVATAQIDECPIADGGEGTVDALISATQGERIQTYVSQPHPPFRRTVMATWGVLGGGMNVAVIEMAAASGLVLVPAAERDPTKTSTYGTGELILAAAERGAKKIIVGIGGSATNDGGCGAAQALGVRFVTHAGSAITLPITGGMLCDIAGIDTSQVARCIREMEIIVACDVRNPLTGPDGASAIYGSQKGATSDQVVALDRGLTHLAMLWRKELRKEVEAMPGAGAAGGLGGGLVAFLGARLQSGAELILTAVRFRERVRGCDLCLTGEGTLDEQSFSGKACAAVAQAAREAGVQTIALVGSMNITADQAHHAGLSEVYVIGKGLTVEESMRRAPELVEQAAYHVTVQWLSTSRR